MRFNSQAAEFNQHVMMPSIRALSSMRKSYQLGNDIQESQPKLGALNFTKKSALELYSTTPIIDA